MSSRRSIKWRVAVLLVCLMALFMCAGLWAYWSVSDRFSKELRAFERSLGGEIERLEFLPTVLSEDPRLKGILNSGEEGTKVSAALALWNRQAGTDFLYLMDDSGTVVAASNYLDSLSFVGRNYGFRPYFNAALNNGTASFFAVGATTGEPGYFLASSVADDSGKHIGVLVSKSDLSPLDTWQSNGLDWLVVDDLGHVILANRSQALYSPWQAREGQREAAVAQRRYAPAHEGFRHRALGRGMQISGGPWGLNLNREQGFSSEPWTLVVALSLKEVLIMVLWRFGLLLLLVTTFALAYTLYRQRGRRAQELAAKVEEARVSLNAAQTELIRQESWATLGAMSTALVHEVNQPLNSLRFDMASLKQLHRQTPETRDEALQGQVLDQMRRTGDRVARIIESLRLFARGHELSLSPISLNEVCKAARARIVEEKPIQSQNLSLDLPPQDLRATQSSILLEQVLVNLLSNALSASAQEDVPVIRLSLTADRGAYHLEVSDNGPGLPSNFDFSTFAPGQSGKPLGEGFGLGLFLCKTFVERMGGSMRYHRTAGQTVFALDFEEGAAT